MLPRIPIQPMRNLFSFATPVKCIIARNSHKRIHTTLQPEFGQQFTPRRGGLQRPDRAVIPRLPQLSVQGCKPSRSEIVLDTLSTANPKIPPEPIEGNPNVVLPSPGYSKWEKVSLCRTDNSQTNNYAQAGPSDSNYARIKAQDRD